MALDVTITFQGFYHMGNTSTKYPEDVRKELARVLENLPSYYDIAGITNPKRYAIRFPIYIDIIFPFKKYIPKIFMAYFIEVFFCILYFMKGLLMLPFKLILIAILKVKVRLALSCLVQRY